MPAMLDDPTSPAIYRTSGSPPYPTPYAPLPPTITPRAVTLRDRSTIATLVPFSSPSQVPKSLVAYLCALLNREIEKGDTYPMINALPEENFGPYWFANFGAVMFLGELARGVEDVWEMQAKMDAAGSWDWGKTCLGSFYVKPNYPGRSSHVCNGGFLVTDAARNRGVGRLMGEGYLEWAPKLGYSYSVFNLVYETNIASVRIWDALGFKRIGRVPGCGNLKSHPDTLIDAIIFGRDLNGEAEDYLSEERFDKIRYYLKTGQYPNGSDRAEKSRLRSAGAHYRLVGSDESETGEEKLMLKDKEVISDPQKQYEIAHKTHSVAHAGINKTTASIADKYHWIRIKETVSQAIRNCAECRESSKAGGSAPTTAGGGSQTSKFTKSATSSEQRASSPRVKLTPQAQMQSSGGAPTEHTHLDAQQHLPPHDHQHHPSLDQHMQDQPHHLHHHDMQHQHPHESLQDMHTYAYDDEDVMPVDPQIMDYQHHFGSPPPSDPQQHAGSHDGGFGHPGFFSHGASAAEDGVGVETEMVGSSAPEGLGVDDSAEEQLRVEMEAQMGGASSSSGAGAGGAGE